MNVIIYLLPLALGLGLTGLVAFLWSLRTGQYDDMEGAAVRVLEDDDVEAVMPHLAGPARAGHLGCACPEEAG